MGHSKISLRCGEFAKIDKHGKTEFWRNKSRSVGYKNVRCYAKILFSILQVIKMSSEAPAAEISISDFMKIDVRAATVLKASPNKGARKPAFVLELDFGDELGIKTTSAQITDLYDCEALIGRQVVAVINFPPIRIAGVKSEVLVLGVVTPEGVSLLRPDHPVKNGLKVA